MLIEISCECGRSVEVVDEDLLGKSLPCPTCGKAVPVPGRQKIANESTREVVPVKPSDVAAAPALAKAPAAKPALPADGERCALCGRRFRKTDVICEGCGTNLATGEPPPVKRFAGRRFDSRYMTFGAIVIALAAASIGVYRV